MDKDVSLSLSLSLTHTHTHTHTQEYHSATKKTEILPFATTWMNLGDIMLNGISLTERDIYCMISLIGGE